MVSVAAAAEVPDYDLSTPDSVWNATVEMARTRLEPYDASEDHILNYTVMLLMLSGFSGDNLQAYVNDVLDSIANPGADATLAEPSHRPSATDQALAGGYMNRLGLVAGRGGGNLALDGTITRAELITIMVRALGAADQAEALKGTSPFPDVPGTHWASGYVAAALQLAESNGFGLGMPDGTFGPDLPVTEPQVIAFTMKFMGLQPKAGLAWPEDYIAGARDAYILGSQHLVLDQPASRGVSFYYLLEAFMKDMLLGESVIQANLDRYNTQVARTDGPLLHVDAIPPTTVANTVTITGEAQGVLVIMVGTAANPVPVFPSADGRFSVTLPAEDGLNTYQVVAMDLLFDTADVTVEVTRIAP